MTSHTVLRMNLEKYRHAMIRFRTYNGNKGKMLTIRQACALIGIAPDTHTQINNRESCYAITGVKLAIHL